MRYPSPARHQTTNLGVRSSNLFGRAKTSTNIGLNCVPENVPCRIKKSAWYLHGSTHICCNSAKTPRAETESAILFQPRIITEPNDFVAEVHDRMPVILEEDDFEPRLREGGTAFLKPAANDLLQKWPVSKRVNSSRAPDDDPTLIEAV